MRIMACMTKSGLPKSVRIFLRREKARLRREISDVQEVEKKITELIEDVMKMHSRNKKPIRPTEGRYALREKILT